MIVRRPPLWQLGQCTSGQLSDCVFGQCMVVACSDEDCTEKRCDTCPGMYSCRYCGLPFCDRHRDLQDHTCLGITSWVPQCPWCELKGRAAKQCIGWAHSCEECFQPTCTSRHTDNSFWQCPTDIRCCQGRCGRDVCGFCGRRYQLPGPESRWRRRFLCHSCAVHCNVLDGADVLTETVHGRTMLRPWWWPPPAS